MATNTRRPRSVGTPAPVQTTDLVQRHDPHALLAFVGVQEINVNIPEDAKIDQVEDTLSIAIAGYKDLADASERLKPIIGRILLVVQDRKLWKPAYRNFTDYLTRKVVEQMKFGRSNAFEALKIARAFPTMSNEDYSKYGASRLLLASSVVSEDTEGYQEVLTQSLNTTVDKFKEDVRGLRATSTTRKEVFLVAIRTNAELREHWQTLLKDTGLSASDLLAQMIDAFYVAQKRAPAPRAQRAPEVVKPNARQAPAPPVQGPRVPVHA